MVLILDMTLREKDSISTLAALTDDYLGRMHARKINKIPTGRRLTEIYDICAIGGIIREWSPHGIKMTLPIDPFDPDTNYVNDIAQRLSFLGIGPGTDDYKWILADAQKAFDNYLIKSYREDNIIKPGSRIILPGTKEFHI